MPLERGSRDPPRDAVLRPLGQGLHVVGGIVIAVLVSGILLTEGGNVEIEHAFLYFPARELVATPKSVGLAFEEVWFGPDSRLHGWFVPGAGPVTILWLHGNAGNISHRVEWLKLLHAHLGASFFLFDYGGYGSSGGRPSEENLYRDARAALAYLRTRPDVDAARVVYYGKSLGGAVAAQLASEASPHRLVLQSTFTSLLAMGQLHYPFLPVRALVRSRYATIDKIGSVRAPVLIVHGARDEIVPLQHAQLLYEAAAQPKQLAVFDGAGHNDLITLGGARYLRLLREFCRDGPADEPPPTTEDRPRAADPDVWPVVPRPSPGARPEP